MEPKRHSYRVSRCLHRLRTFDEDLLARMHAHLLVVKHDELEQKATTGFLFFFFNHIGTSKANQYSNGKIHGTAIVTFQALVIPPTAFPVLEKEFMELSQGSGLVSGTLLLNTFY